MDSVSLFELNVRIRQSLEADFPTDLWVRAEISELKENANGHAYLDLVEKDGSRIVAKMKAMCWRQTYAMLKPFFIQKTGQPLAPGMKVLLACVVNFHEQFGLSLVITDIDPSFTLGDMARQRQETIARLRKEGVFDMNRSISMPRLPQRIAVISSATAAGYGDFQHQLNNNEGHFVFYTHLFQAVMQDELTAPSIIAALERIYEHADWFDVVVIIRGGGATADLSSFDDYSLAANCAQFPLPILTGIGHLRDTCVLDMVANVCAKTPTAVAEFLVGRIAEEAGQMSLLADRMRTAVRDCLTHRNDEVLLRSSALHRHAVESFGRMRQVMLLHRLRLRETVAEVIRREQHRVESLEKDLKLNSPIEMMRRGFFVATKDGQRIHSAAELQDGDKVNLFFHDGTHHALITS